MTGSCDRYRGDSHQRERLALLLTDVLTRALMLDSMSLINKSAQFRL
jgi:hypothetical protein